MACRPVELDCVQKTQLIRVFDVILIGPLMVMGGRDLGRSLPIAGGLLEFFGISTIVYNARNWYRIDRAMRRERGLGRWKPPRRTR